MPVQYVTFTVEVSARVDCEMEECDYGVRGSGVWGEPIARTVEASGFDVDGVKFDIDDLPDDVKLRLEELACDAALEKGEWL